MFLLLLFWQPENLNLPLKVLILRFASCVSVLEQTLVAVWSSEFGWCFFFVAQSIKRWMLFFLKVCSSLYSYFQTVWSKLSHMLVNLQKSQSFYHLLSSVCLYQHILNQKRGYVLWTYLSSFSVYEGVLTLIYWFNFLCWNEMQQYLDLILILPTLRNIDLEQLFS